MTIPMTPSFLLTSGNGVLLNDFKTAVMILGAILVMFSIPGSLAIWLYWRRMRPRTISLRFQDEQAFLYQLTEGLRRFGFRREATPDDRVLFEPSGMQKLVGVMSIAVDLPDSGLAQISGSAVLIRNVKGWFPNASYQKYLGPTPYRRWMNGYLKLFGIGLATILVIAAGALAYEYSRQPADSAPGVRSGTRLRFRGQGLEGQNGAATGDL